MASNFEYKQRYEIILLKISNFIRRLPLNYFSNIHNYFIRKKINLNTLLIIILTTIHIFFAVVFHQICSVEVLILNNWNVPNGQHINIILRTTCSRGHFNKNNALATCARVRLQFLIPRPSRCGNIITCYQCAHYGLNGDLCVVSARVRFLLFFWLPSSFIIVI